MTIDDLVRGALRPSRCSSRPWNLGKTLLQILVFWSVLLGVVPSGIAALERRVGFPSFTFPDALAWGAFGVASVAGLWSGLVMAWQGRGTPLPTDCAQVLVLGGPYRFVRNPMAVAGLAQGFCVGMVLGSWLTLAYVVAGGLIWNQLVRPGEEADLEARFGAPYRAYRRGVRCWIPRLRAYRPRHLTPPAGDPAQD